MEDFDLPRKRRKTRPSRRKYGEGGAKLLSESIKPLMGEANMHFTFQEYEQAIQKCHEIIRTDPEVPDPYQLLALTYEKNGDKEKALEFYMLSAFLTPKV